MEIDLSDVLMPANPVTDTIELTLWSNLHSISKGNAKCNPGMIECAVSTM